MRKETSAIWFLFIYSLSVALKINISPSKSIKEIGNANTAENLFLKLMDLENGSWGGFRALAVLLKSESTPFRKQYLKYCETYTVFGFLGIQKYSRKYRNLDISQIISPDCISASKVNFHVFERILYNFFKRRGSFPILSKNYKPSQWSIELFFETIREAVRSNLKPDWNSFCGDVKISSKHFSQDLWNSEDKLWRLLNFNCINRMTRSNRIILRSKYLEIFKPNQDSTQKEALMKIISLIASYQTLKSWNTKIPKENLVTKDLLNSLLNYIISVDEESNQGPSIIPSIAVRLIKSCGFKPDHSTSLSSPPKIMIKLYLLLRNEPTVNSNWLLNLIYLALTSPLLMPSDYILNVIIDWFFSLDPSTSNICQLLELISDNNTPKFLKNTLRRIELNPKLLTDVYKECPMLSKSISVPYDERLKMLLRTARTFPSQILSLKISFSRKDDFEYLLQAILEKESLIFSQNYATFHSGFHYFDFKSLEAFFIHFLKTFYNHPELYQLTCFDKHSRLPVIVPSLKTPKKVVFIVMSVLTRSLVLNFKVPFCFHWVYFSAAFGTSNFENLSKSLRLKKLFYNNERMTPDTDLLECDRANRNEGNRDILFEHLTTVNSRSAIQTQISFMLLVSLIESQIKGMAAALSNTFTAEVPFKSREIYKLIFK